MRELRGVVVVLGGLVLAANLIAGGPAAVVLLIVSISHSLTLNLQTVMLAIAVPAFLIGGLVWLSPWHRELGFRLVAGALVVAMVALLGPPFLSWFDAELIAYGRRVFGGAP